MGYYLDYWYIVLVIPALIISAIAQYNIKSSYKKYSKILNSRNITGAHAAQAILNYYGITDVQIARIGGKLTDNFNPRTKVISLSENVFSGSSVASVGVACHEAGHAAQHATGYLPIKLRNSFLPVCKIGSVIGIPLAIAGYFLGFGFLIDLGILLYATVFVFQLITLPVEFNASRRALEVINETGLLVGEEQEGARKVLTAAAMTYVASMLVSLANLLRLIFRLNNRRR